MKKVLFIIGLCSVLFYSCQADLLSSPNVDLITGSSSSDGARLTAPASLTASHGGYRSVTLSWKSSGGAARYNIYAASSPYDKMEQVGETKDASTTYTIGEDSGVSKYYCVAAVDYDRNISSYSRIAYGSTLAVPIITGIDNGDDGSSATVTWWMSNCSSSTYQNNVRYEVFCYAEDKTTQVGQSITVSGGTNSVTFTGLSGKTTYYYKVAAYNTNAQSEKQTEYSDLLDAETAHRLIPNPAVDFTAAQGTSKEYIELNWTLPDFVDCKTGAASYERHPVYFTIERKLRTADDSEYKVIVPYIGIKIEETKTKVPSGGLYFDCENAANCSDGVSVEPSSPTDVETSEAYPAYIPFSKVTYRDSDGLSRGEQYSYRIQSFVDDTASVISADSAVATTYGHLLSVPKLNTSAKYTYTDDTQETFSSVTVSFVPALETFGSSTSYSFMLKEYKTPLVEGGVESESDKKTWTTIRDVATFTKSFDCSKSETHGYYRYTLFVLPSGSNDEAAAYDSVTAAGQVTVTDEAKNLKSVEYFDVKDGYSNKFVLTWDYADSCKYKIKWRSSKDNFTTEQEHDFTDDELKNLPTEEKDGVTYISYNLTQDVESGEKRQFTIIANSGLESSKTLRVDDEDESSDPKEFETLGTPSLSFDANSADYTTITVTWPAVQKAKSDGYTVSAVYEDETTELVTSETPSIENGTVSFVLREPTGFDKALKAGKTIKLTVTAKSATEDTTSSTVETRLLGPALVDAKFADSDMNANSIQLTWNKVSGAAGYIVRRVRYADSNGNSTDDDGAADTYFVTDTAVSFEGTDVPSDIAIIESPTNGTLRFTDKYAEGTLVDNQKFMQRQGQICWGLPYGYIVLPVKDKGDFIFEDDPFTLASASKVNYTELTNLRTLGATYGYGQNIKATKAISGDTVTIEWELPYNKTAVPSIYKRLSGSSDKWQRVNSANASSTVFNEKITLNETGTNTNEVYGAYDYIVRYSSNSSSIDMPPSFVNHLKDTKEARYTYASGKSEPQNKGYLLTMQLSAEYNGNWNGSEYAKDDNYYSEKALWEKWDYDVRALGPEKITLGIKNNNLLGGGYVTVAEIDPETGLVKENTQEDQSALATKVKLTKSDGYELAVSPVWADGTTGYQNGSGYTDGVLKILRDAKHYYSLILERESHEVKTADVKEVYAYRQITDEELVKGALLVMAYGFYINDGGNRDLTNVTSHFKYGGESSKEGADFTGRSRATSELGLGKYKMYYTFTDYAPSLLFPNGEYGKLLKLSSSKNLCGIQGDADNYIYTLKDTHILKISSVLSDLPKGCSYDAELSLSCDNDYTVKVSLTRNSTTRVIVDTTDRDVRRTWFPMQIYRAGGVLNTSNYGDSQYWIKDTAYGWWPAE